MPTRLFILLFEAWPHEKKTAFDIGVCGGIVYQEITEIYAGVAKLLYILG